MHASTESKYSVNLIQDQMGDFFSLSCSRIGFWTIVRSKADELFKEPVTEAAPEIADETAATPKEVVDETSPTVTLSTAAPTAS